MEDLSRYIPKVHFEQIPIKNLVSNQEYQRNLSASHIRHTAANFDLYQINPVKVSRRNGINYVFNGQHTVEIIALVSGSRETPVWCMVYDDLEYKEEADIFANQQKYVRSLSPYEIFTANIEAGNDDELLIKSLVESYGLFITGNKAPGGICAISTLCYIFNHHGYQALDRVLRLCIGAWEGDADSLSANILKGIMHLVVTYGDALRDDLFKEKVGAFSVREIGRTAKERKAGSLGYAEAMLLIYNKKIKKPLRVIELYSRKKSSHSETEYTDIDENEELLTDEAELESEQTDESEGAE